MITGRQMKSSMKPILGSFAVVLAYIELSHFWVEIGGFSGLRNYLEIPILLLLFLIFYIPNSSLLKSITFTSYPIILTYIFYDIFYSLLKRVPRIDDLQNASTVFDFSYLLATISIFIFLIASCYFLYEYIKHLKRLGKPEKTKELIFKSILLFVSLVTPSLPHFHLFYEKIYKNTVWSQERNIKENGRFASVLYFQGKSNQARANLKNNEHLAIDSHKVLFSDTSIQLKKNVYIAVLESFIDPRELVGIDPDTNYLAKNLSKHLPNSKFSFVNSPVYGGGTAQAELEVLTGIKAYGKIDSVDFNSLEGGPVSGFTNLLKKNGYETFATIATNAGYYNSAAAYKSIGFDLVRFLAITSDFKQNKNDHRIFDGDVFDYNLKHMPNLNAPYLFYSLGMYGHFPYDRNLKDRPDIFEVTHPDERVKRVIHQFYYRTHALGSYIDRILEFDEKSIILAISDHLPPLLSENVKYKREKHSNIALLLIDGKFIDVNDYNYYELSQRILSDLAPGYQPKKLPEKTMENVYFQMLSDSMHN